MPQPVDILQVTAALMSLRGLVELGLVAACYGVAWLVDHWIQRYRSARHGDADLLPVAGGVVRVFYPLAVLLLLVIVRAGYRRYAPSFFFEIAIPLAIALAAIRMFVYVLRRLFARADWLRTSERAIGFAIWTFAILYFIGVLPGIARELDAIELPLGKGRVSLLTVLTGALVIVATLVVTLWISGFIEARLMAAQIDANMRVVMAKVVRAVLLMIGILIALQTIGFDLTLLSVFGGALGVGIGLGLQRLAANYIAGFTILLDRSIRLGDIITVEDRQGVVSRLTSRYVVVRSGDGVEAIVPNETLVTKTVLNHSYTDRQQRVAVRLVVVFGTDLDLALRLMVEAARAHARSLPDPAPQAFVVRCAETGIELELGVWLGDPEQGALGLSSDLLRAILAAFQANGIAVPVKQDPRLFGRWPEPSPEPDADPA